MNKSIVASITALSFGALVFSSSAAHARTWYILNFKTGTCMTAETILAQTPTPAQFHIELRNEGVTDEVKVKKNDDGEVYAVIVTLHRQGAPVTLLWFPSPDNCETARKAAIANGALPNADDLK